MSGTRPGEVVTATVPQTGERVTMRLGDAATAPLVSPFGPNAVAPTAPADVTAPLSNFFADWVASGQRAMAAEPTYFSRWEGLKTGLLLLALGGVAYLMFSDDESGGVTAHEP